MINTDLYAYYSFGHNYRLLLDCGSNTTNSELFGYLQEYFDFINRLKLTVTRSGITLKGLSNDFSALRKAGQGLNAKKPVDKDLLTRINKKLLEVDHILDAELKTKVGYILEEKRYSTENLLQNVSKLFGVGVFDLLPTLTQFDLEECGKCLAFDRYTACAFHILRATESVLQLYYGKLLSKKPKGTETWGGYTKALRDAIDAGKLNPSPSEELMINLDNLRKYYRNKTQHPQLVYSCDTAQDLLGMCTKTVNDIVADLRKRKLLIA
jgi:hypothetical protein